MAKPIPSRRAAGTAASGTLHTPKRARAKKISITVDEAVLAEVRALIRGTGRSLSAHINEAVARDLRHRRLGDLITAYETKHGSLREDDLEAARRSWQG